jgi:hypothetical protein
MVVPYKNHHLKRKLFIVASLIVIVALFFSGMHVGSLKQAQQLQILEKDKTILAQHLESTEKKLTEAQQTLANLQMGKAIDSQAEVDVRKVILNLKQENQQLHEKLTMYKQIMARSKQNSLLRIDRVVISQAEKPNTYHYQLILAQLGKHPGRVKGQGAIIIEGTQGGANVQGLIEKGKWVKLPAGAKDVKKEINFKFRYFQELDGELELPPDLKPSSIKVSVTGLVNRHRQAIDQTFNWELDKG